MTWRQAEFSTCRRCEAPILEGPDDDVAARIVKADPVPLDTTTEVIAVATGRWTFTAWPVGKNIELHKRQPPIITGQPAGQNSDRPVIAEHKCGAPLGRIDIGKIVDTRGGMQIPEHPEF